MLRLLPLLLTALLLPRSHALSDTSPKDAREARFAIFQFKSRDAGGETIRYGLIRLSDGRISWEKTAQGGYCWATWSTPGLLLLTRQDSNGRNPRTRIHDLRTGRLLRDVEGRAQSIRYGRRHMLCLFNEEGIRLLDASGERELASIQGSFSAYLNTIPGTRFAVISGKNRNSLTGIDLENGREAWTKDGVRNYRKVDQNLWAWETNGTSIDLLNIENGTTAKTLEFGSRIRAVTTTRNHILVYGGSRVAAYEKKGGARVWSSEFEGTVTGAWGYPTGLVVLSANGVRVDIIDPTNGRSIWNQRLEGARSVSWSYSRDHFFQIDYTAKKITCIDIRGRRVAWTSDGDSFFSSSPNGVCVLRRTGGYHGIDAKTGRELWKAGLSKRISWPSLSGRRFFHADEADLLARDVVSGKILWRVSNGGGCNYVYVSPIKRR